MCFIYDGYIEFAKRTIIRKTQAAHRCSECRKPIAAGSAVVYESGKFDGEFYANYTCEECERLRYAVARDELRRGCPFHGAWCPNGILRDYVADRAESGEPPLIVPECEFTDEAMDRWLNEQREAAKETQGART